LVSPHSHNRPDMNLPWSARTDLFEMNILSFCCTWSAVLCIKLCIAAPTLQWPFKSHSVQIQLQPFSGQRNSSHSSVAGQVTCTHARNSIFIIKNHLQSLLSCTWSAVLCIKLCIAAPTLQWPFKSHSVQMQPQPFQRLEKQFPLFSGWTSSLYTCQEFHCDGSLGPGGKN